MPRHEEALRVVRVLHLTMVLSVLAIIAAGELIRGQTASGGAAENLELIHKVLLVLLVATIGVVAMLRTRFVAPAAEEIRTRPDDDGAWTRWRGGNITSFVLCESIALLGFALRFLGGELLQAAPFYAVSLVLLVFFTPRTPVTS